MKIKLGPKDYTPKSRAQKFFMEYDLKEYKEVTLGGASGTGKTVALIISSLGPKLDGSMQVDNPNYRGIILRREATQLEKSGLISTAQEWYKNIYPKVDYNGSLRRFTFPSGAQITFSGCESEQDALKFKGFTKLHFVGFEELTQFTQNQFDIISTRLRDLSEDIPKRIRCTTNPGDVHEDWVLERYKYWLYNSCLKELDVPIKAKYAQPLYTYVDEDHPDMPTIVTEESKGEVFAFIETFAKDILKDNIQNLGKIADPVLREQLLRGIWGLKAGAGMYFSMQDFPESTSKAGDLAVRIRYWDKACSGPKGDYLAGLLVAHYIDGTSRYMIEDIVLCKPNVSEVESIIKKTAERDGRYVYIGFEQEPGSSGKEIVEKYKTMLQRDGYRVVIDIKKATKLDRAAFISPLAKEHLISYIDNSSVSEMFNQLSNFPSKGVHDDAVDSLTGAIFMLQNHLPRPLTKVFVKANNKAGYAMLEQIMNTPSVFTR